MEEKDLTKMTVANLREEAKKYTSIQGIHAMKKEELIRAIADVRGEPIEIKKKKPKKKRKAMNIADVKKQIKELRVKKEEARKTKDVKMVDRLRKKIKMLKKQTRKFAKEKAEASAPAGKKEEKASAPAEKKE
ncbi:MAG: hypothetical protein KAJ00_01090, partial [Deltaproteobacteria bacterium]|nr:hypothetical protein [Deltaproteobacteria bacterium]